MLHNSLDRSSRQLIQRLGKLTLGSLMSFSAIAYPLQAKADVNSVRFDMYPVAQFVPCLAKPGLQPKVHVTVAVN